MVRRGQVDEDSRDSRVKPVSLTGLRNWLPAPGREAEGRAMVPWAEARLMGPRERSVPHTSEDRVILSFAELLLFSCSVMSDSLRPHGQQQARLPCPSPSPWVCSNSCPLSQWGHPTISSSVTPFSGLSCGSHVCLGAVRVLAAMCVRTLLISQMAWLANTVPQKQVSLFLGTCVLPLVILRHYWGGFWVGLCVQGHTDSLHLSLSLGGSCWCLSFPLSC